MSLSKSPGSGSENLQEKISAENFGSFNPKTELKKLGGEILSQAQNDKVEMTRREALKFGGKVLAVMALAGGGSAIPKEVLATDAIPVHNGPEKHNHEVDYGALILTYDQEIREQMEILGGKIAELKSTKPEVAEALATVLVPKIQEVLNTLPQAVKGVSAAVYGTLWGNVVKTAGYNVVPKHYDLAKTGDMFTAKFKALPTDEQENLTQALVMWYVGDRLNFTNNYLKAGKKMTATGVDVFTNRFFTTKLGILFEYHVDRRNYLSSDS